MRGCAILMKTVILSTSPYSSQSYEQGIEVALNLAEAEQLVQVLLVGDFEQAYFNSQDQAVFRKKLKQLALFDIPCVSTKEEHAYLDDGVLTF